MFRRCKILYSFNRFLAFEHVKENVEKISLGLALAENCKLYHIGDITMICPHCGKEAFKIGIATHPKPTYYYQCENIDCKYFCKKIKSNQ